MPVPAHLSSYRATGVWNNLSIADHALVRADAAPDTVLFPNDPSRPTYSSVLRDAQALCTSLTDLGLNPGDVVSFQTPNWVETAVINLAAAIGGFVINPIVTIYRDAEVLQMLSDSGAKALFLCENFRNFDHLAMIERIRGDLPELRGIIPVRGSSGQSASFEDMVANGRNRPAPKASVDPDAPKLLLYTSGTTGRPKGVLHSHNTLSRIAQTSFKHWGLGENDHILMPSPVTHISGYTNGLEQPFLSGTRTVLMESWDAADALALIEKYGISGTVAATPFLQELAQHARSAGRTLPGFRIFACGGASVPANLVRDANAAFETPCAFRVYGSSETPLVTLGFPADRQPELAAATDGAVADYDVRIVDETGQEVPGGMEGEIIVRGPAMFLGYADPRQTAEALTEDGFFRTGDLGCLSPDNALTITGRKKDLIIRGGENISAKEIEDVLQRHVHVLEAAVVAMPHPRLGEGICAFVIMSDEGSRDADDIMAHVASSGLARQKTPERIIFVSDFPRTASGKIRKDILRSTAKEAV